MFKWPKSFLGILIVIMGDIPINESSLEVYVDTLEQQIEDKKFFIKQARDALESLHDSGLTAYSISSEKLQSFMKRPMFFPERSDPIGLSLTSASLSSRQESSEHWLEDTKIQLDDMGTMIRDQQQINHEMTVLLELLQQKLEIPPIENHEIEENAVQRNKRLRNELSAFVQDFLSLDLADSVDSAEQVYRDFMAVIERLINYDTNLKTTDFPPSTRGLFRLLLRGNLITLHDVGGESYVKFLDFATSEVI